MTINGKELFDSLKKKPYVHIPFSIKHAQLDDAMDSYIKFLALSDEVKNHIDLKISPMHRRGDIGFKHRDPSEDIYNDSKDFFHFHPLILEEYGEFMRQQPVVEEFLNKAKPIWDEVYNVTYQIISSFDNDFPGASSKIFDTENVHVIIRFLKYDWANSGKYLAKPHFDAGSFTLALAESCQGLRIGKGPDDLETVDHQDGQAIFMLSSNFQKIIDTDELAAGWHDVVQLDETQLGKPFARWAIVTFIEGHSVEALPRAETHKWYKSREQ